MKPSKKNKFFTFIFSFLPGAGEMYMGFMKMGISLMGLFFGVIAVTGLANMPIFMLLMVLVWFYSFFHVHHLSGLSDVEFEKVTDGFLHGLKILDHETDTAEKYRKWFAYLLIGLGVLFLWGIAWELFQANIRYLPESVSYVLWFIRDAIPRVAIAILVIVMGARLIRGKKQTLFTDTSEPSMTDGGNGQSLVIDGGNDAGNLKTADRNETGGGADDGK